jgi:hypothetical protein
VYFPDQNTRSDATGYFLKFPNTRHGQETCKAIYLRFDGADIMGHQFKFDECWPKGLCGSRLRRVGPRTGEEKRMFKPRDSLHYRRAASSVRKTLSSNTPFLFLPGIKL